MKTNDRYFEAISWKCEELGVSYGTLVSRSTEWDMQQIYKEYDRYSEEKKKAIEARTANRRAGGQIEDTGVPDAAKCKEQR